MLDSGALSQRVQRTFSRSNAESEMRSGQEYLGLVTNLWLPHIVILSDYTAGSAKSSAYILEVLTDQARKLPSRGVGHGSAELARPAAWSCRHHVKDMAYACRLCAGKYVLENGFALSCRVLQVQKAAKVLPTTMPVWLVEKRLKAMVSTRNRFGGTDSVALIISRCKTRMINDSNMQGRRQFMPRGVRSVWYWENGSGSS